MSKSSSTSHSWFKRNAAPGAKEGNSSSTAGRALTTLKAFRVGSLGSKSSSSSFATSRISPSVYTLPLPSPGETDSQLSPFASTLATTKGSSLSPATSDYPPSSSYTKTEESLSPASPAFVDSLRPSQDDPFANLYGSSVNSGPPPHPHSTMLGSTDINSRLPSISNKGRRLSSDEQTSNLIPPVASSSRTDQRVANTTDRLPPSSRAGHDTGSRNKRKDSATNRGIAAAAVASSSSSVAVQSKSPSFGTRYVDTTFDQEKLFFFPLVLSFLKRVFTDLESYLLFITMVRFAPATC